MDATLGRIRQIKKRPDLRFPEREIVGLYDKYLVTDESQIKERFFFVLTKVNKSYKILTVNGPLCGINQKRRLRELPKRDQSQSRNRQLLSARSSR